MNISGFAAAQTNGLQALNKSQDGINQAARELAKATLTPQGESPKPDIVQPLVQLRVEEINASAAARVIDVADKTLGQLLDIKA